MLCVFTTFFKLQNKPAISERKMNGKLRTSSLFRKMDITFRTWRFSYIIFCFWGVHSKVNLIKLPLDATRFLVNHDSVPLYHLTPRQNSQRKRFCFMKQQNYIFTCWKSPIRDSSNSTKVFQEMWRTEHIFSFWLWLKRFGHSSY